MTCLNNFLGESLAGNGPLSEGNRTFIFENTAKPGNKPAWKEHLILNGFVAHEGLAGDVDADGDLDIVSKEWTSGSLYYLENLLNDLRVPSDSPVILNLFRIIIKFLWVF